MLYVVIHIIHLFSVFIYGGFLFVDNLFLSKIKQSYSEDEHTKIRETFMIHVRKVVPYSLIVAVISGIYLATNIFGEVSSDGLSTFQILLSAKIFLGSWLGFRGINQKLFGINPWVFKSHIFPFALVVVILLLSQLMFALN
jgi:hypothetical protein